MCNTRYIKWIILDLGLMFSKTASTLVHIVITFGNEGEVRDIRLTIPFLLCGEDMEKIIHVFERFLLTHFLHFLLGLGVLKMFLHSLEVLD